MRSIAARVIRLEEHRPQGCPICRDWSTGTLEIVFGDGHGGEGRTEPRRLDGCPACGRSVPPVDRNVIVFGCRPDGPQ